MSRESALKAWETRRFNKRSEIALKAVATRKSNILKSKRSVAAHKAWAKRRSNIS
jgi:hypothetical protein